MSDRAHYLTYQCIFWRERAKAGSRLAGSYWYWGREVRRVAAELIGAGL